jgi:hypothetical protein
MKKVLAAIFVTMCLQFATAQTTTTTVGITTAGFNDSTFVIQTGSTDSFHQGNHPGAGAYSGAEILICEGATLKYNYPPGTSNVVRFYLDKKAKLIVNAPNSIIEVFMKDSASVDALNQNVYIFPGRRVASAQYLNVPRALIL